MKTRKLRPEALKMKSLFAMTTLFKTKQKRAVIRYLCGRKERTPVEVAAGELSTNAGLASDQRAILEQPAVHTGQSPGDKEGVETGALGRRGPATGVARLGVVAGAAVVTSEGLEGGGAPAGEGDGSVSIRSVQGLTRIFCSQADKD